MPRKRQVRGKVWRKGHYRTTRSGKRIYIKGQYVKSVRTGHYKWAKKETAKRRKSASIARRKYGTRKCPPGTILRAGYVRAAYTRKDGTRVKRTVVKPTCIPDVGRPGRGPRKVGGKVAKIGPVRKGTLRKYGYSTSKPITERWDALYDAIQHEGRTPIMRKVNALYVWNKNKNPRIAAIAAEDKQWIRDNIPLR